MTVSSAVNRKEFAGDDATTSFATTPLKFFESSDMQVYVTNDTTGVATLLTEGTHYTVSGGDASSGAVGTVDLSGGSSPHGALLSGTTLVILRELPLLQGVDFVQNDASNAEVAEAALDKLVMNVQRLDDRLDRSLVVSDGDVSGADFTVPTPSASKLLGWASNGLTIVNYALTDLTVSAVPAYALDIITAADDDAFFATMVDGMTAEGTLAVGDLFAFVDVSLTPDDGRKCTVQELFNALNVLTAETAPATGDSLLLYDADGAAADKITLENVLKVVNSLTEDTTPDSAADFVLAYDTSTSGVKKVKPESFGMNPDTAVATTSGTEVDFTIPAGAKQVVVTFSAFQLSGSDTPYLQIGDSGGVETTSYVASSSSIAGTVATTDYTAAFGIRLASVSVYGTITLTLVDAATNTWVASGIVKGGTNTCTVAGGRALDSALTTVRITRSGTNTLSTGLVNVAVFR